MSDHSYQEYEGKSVPELSLYSDFLDIAFSQFNVDLLVKIWMDSLTLDKHSLKELNTRILERLPLLCEHFGLQEVHSFPKFVKKYDEYVYTSLCKKNPDGCLKFFIEKNDFRNARKAVRKGARVRRDNLYAAALGGSKKIVKYFLTHYSYELREGLGAGLKGAAQGGHKDLIKIFMKRGVDVNYGLEGAAISNNKELLDFFLSKGAVNWDQGLKGAVAGGHLDLAKSFFRKGASNRSLLLEEASRNGHLNVVQFLLEEGDEDFDLSKFEPVEGSYDTYEAILSAALNGHLEVVKYLSELGVVITYDNMLGIAANGRKDVLLYLLDHGMEDGIGQAMEGAAMTNRKDLVKELIQWTISNTNIGSLKKAIVSGLEGAVQSNLPAIAELLVEYATDIPDYLIWSTFRNNTLELARVLLEKQALLKQDEDYESDHDYVDINESFEFAMNRRSKDLEAVKLILEFGGDPKALLMYARNYGNKKMIEFALSLM